MALPISKSLTSKDKKSKKETQRDSSSGEDNIYEVEKIVGMTNVEVQDY